MDPERWARIEAICFDALERAAAERAAFLDAACVGDAALRAEVEALIDGHEADPRFLDAPFSDLAALAAGALDTAAADPPDGGLPAGTMVGPYRVQRPLGRGGMGVVYLASREADDIRQQVALKIVGAGAATDDVVRRFRQERSILASLAHPNIAHLLDASALPDGRPYFVMEYVDGEQVDTYCARHGLDVVGRLELFRKVCGAVQHAHQNLVVHRDIKPGNILVTRDGEPKLLDFGIGKVLAETASLAQSVETRTLVRRMTPEYAAPEQVRGGPVTTATDVYALGVLLYVLLAGRHPYADGAGNLQDLEHAVLTTEPRRPSAVVAAAETRRRLAGDLDTIVLKALRKEPERRYPTAAALADDIGRYLAGRPVLARPDTIGYRAGKFLRRNAAWVSAAVIAFAGLAAVAGVMLVQSRRLSAEADRTLTERDRALEVRAFLMEMFGASGADRGVGDTVTARQLLDLQAATLTGAYADVPELRAEFMEVLADGYDRLGLYRDAEPLARDALALRRALAGSADPALAGSLNLYGWVVHQLGRSDEAEPLLREAVAIRRAAGARQRAALARSLNDLGVVLNALRRHDEAESVLTEALALRLAEYGEGHRTVGVTASNLAATHYYRSELEAAIVAGERAVRALEASVGPDHQRTLLARSNLAGYRLAAGDRDGAAGDYRALLDQQGRLGRGAHPVTARIMTSLAVVQLDRGQGARDARLLAEAESLFVGGLDILEATLGPAHTELVVPLDRLAATQAARGRPADAVASAERALRIVWSALGPAHPAAERALMRAAGYRYRAERPRAAGAADDTLRVHAIADSLRAALTRTGR